MWKIISLFTLVVLVQAADIHDIYGDWWEVAFYPVSTNAPVCQRFRFAKHEENCIYADGRNATLVQATMMNDKGEIIEGHNVAMMMLNTPAEVMPALNISVNCDGKDMPIRAAVRLANEDYFIFYAPIQASMEHARNEIEPNIAVLFGRNIVSSEQLRTVMMSIEDLKNRRGTQMCTTENYGGSNPRMEMKSRM